MVYLSSKIWMELSTWEGVSNVTRAYRWVSHTCRKYFGCSEATFSITVPGRTFYVMTSPLNISKALGSLDIFNYDKPIRQIMRQFGISQNGIEIVYSKRTPEFFESSEAGMQSTQKLKSMAEMGGIFLKKQLLPGEVYDGFEATFLAQIEKRMRWDTLSKKAIIRNQPSSANKKTVSLLELVRQTIVESTTVAFLGPTILEIDPEVIDNFLFFDDRLWMFLYNIPRPWASSTLNAMRRLQHSIRDYLQLPEDKRPGASFLATTLEREMRARGVDVCDIAGWLAMLFWV